MSITLTSRKGPRGQLASILDTHVTDLVDVQPYQVKTPAGSPSATVHSDGSATQYPGYANEWHRYIISLWWLREDAETAEDGIDDLSQDVRQTLIDHNTEAGYWDDLVFDETEAEPSEMDYPLIDGVQWRRERIRVRVHVISAS